MSKMTLQLITAFLLAISGIVMLFMGVWIEPAGEIHNSVLVAFGETSTFSGSLFGIDYSYKFRARKKLLKEQNNENNTGTT